MDGTLTVGVCHAQGSLFADPAEQSGRLAVLGQLRTQENDAASDDKLPDIASSHGPNLDPLPEELDPVYRPPERKRVNVLSKIKYSNLLLEHRRNVSSKGRQVDITPSKFLQDHLRMVDGVLPWPKKVGSHL